MALESLDAAVIGAGPAGLAAAEVLAAAGLRPVMFEAKPSPARKFLMAGKSGLNLTKDEPVAEVIDAVGAPRLRGVLTSFGPEAVKAWAEGLGEPLFTGSSGRVFPKAMKASPLLRRWLARLDGAGAELRTRWRWRGWEGEALAFETPEGVRRVKAKAVVLALGGASWPRLGSDGAWAETLAAENVAVATFRPANMGFERRWSAHFLSRFAGAPVKPVALTLGARRARGEFVISGYGVEGSLIYAISSTLRDALEAGDAAPTLDLLPDGEADAIARRLARPRGKASRANHLRKAIGLDGVRAGLLRELAPDAPEEPEALARLLKALPMPVERARPLAEAISSAGGVAWKGIDDDLMLRARPGTFVAGEMIDWEAPTGGYLITACLATGRCAGAAAARWVGDRCR